MADNNKLELVVEVDVNKANASIKSINTGLSSMEQAAGKATRGASAGIDGLTVSMVKGSAAGNLLADSIKNALDWAKEWTLGAAQHAAHTDKMSLSMAALARAHGVSAEASNRAVEAVKKVGFGTQDAIHAVDRLMVADMNLSKAEGLAKVAKDAAAIETSPPARRWRSCSWPSSRARRAGSGPWGSSSISIKRLTARRNSPAGRSTKMRSGNSATTRSCARRQRFRARRLRQLAARRRSPRHSPVK
jgi:hypothetical protein